MFEFDIPQGPMIGTLLEGLEEEQAAGTIHTRQEAIEWIERKIQRVLLPVRLFQDPEK
jgi:hypothetical protein